MRFSEFENEANNIKYIEKELDKILQTLKDDYTKRSKIYKKKIKIARRGRKKGELKASDPSHFS